MREELDSPCTEEITAFDRFIDLASRDTYDVTVFDTAPTRPHDAPARAPDRLEPTTRRESLRLGRDDRCGRRREGALRPGHRHDARPGAEYVRVRHVSGGDAIVKAERAIRELGTVGIPLGLVVANMVLSEDVCQTPYARARYEMQQRYLADIERRFRRPSSKYR